MERAGRVVQSASQIIDANQRRGLHLTLAAKILLRCIQLSLSVRPIRQRTVSNTNCWKLSNRFLSFVFGGNDRAIALGPAHRFGERS
jgi:hypothetical protein